jgi:hypothetical protein
MLNGGYIELAYSKPKFFHKVIAWKAIRALELGSVFQAPIINDEEGEAE